MDPISRARLFGSALALAGAVGLAVGCGLRAGLALAAGYGVGWLAFAGLAGAASLLSGAPGQGGRMVTAGLHLAKFPLLLAVLYVLLIPGHCSPVWLIVGYTVSLVTFLVEISRPRAAQVRPPGAENAE